VYWNGSSWGTLAGNNTTTGLLQQTNSGVPTWVSGSAVTPLVLPPATRTGDVVYWNGTSWLTLPGNNAGTQFLQENASGVPTWATAAVFPSTTRAGDIMYWNSTAWVTLPGNISGTQVLTETATGIPAWSPYVAGGITALTNSIPADVTLAAGFIDGPSVAQGTVGTWLATGTVTLTDTATATYACKLWDGTTVISSGQATAAAAAVITLSLSGTLGSPAGNIRVSCKDAATGKILFNASGNSKDSTVSAIRIQ
jgi:hypothetical protein